MGKKILVAVDESIHAKNALLYASGLFQPAADTQFTLINIQPIISEYFLQEAKADPKMDAALERLLSDNAANSFEILKRSKDILMQEGVAETNIEIVSQIRMLGLTKDIVEYSHKHGFDAIVAGRRGLSRLQKVFMGSTSAKLMEHSGNCPVCIVDGQVRPRRFLVALELGASSLPIIDFMGRIYDGLQGFHVTFFHVLEDFSLNYIAPFTPGISQIEGIIEAYEKQLIDKFKEELKQALAKSAIDESHLEIKTVRRTTKTARMIFEEVQNNDYDTVVLGRTGSGRAFYFGSVSRYVSERLTDHAIWMIG